MKNLLYSEITEKILGAAFEVWKILGYGFLEKVYENSLVEELNLRNIKAKQQYPIAVYYKQKKIGNYIADLLVENKIIVEIKAEKELNLKHSSQLLSYLKATNLRLGLLLNYGERKCTFKRHIM